MAGEASDIEVEGARKKYIGAERFNIERRKEEDERIAYIEKLRGVYKQAADLGVDLPQHAVLETGRTDDKEDYQYLVLFRPNGDVNEIVLKTQNGSEIVYESCNGISFHSTQVGERADKFIEILSDEKGIRARHSHDWYPNELEEMWMLTVDGKETPNQLLQIRNTIKPLIQRFQPIDSRGGMIYGTETDRKDSLRYEKLESLLPKGTKVLKRFGRV